LSAALFGVPLPGRCLSPLPAPIPRGFEKGALVCWVPDYEQGTVIGVTAETVTVAWEESQSWTYALCSGAVDNIAVFETADGEAV
jgi:hypothetical protein